MTTGAAIVLIFVIGVFLYFLKRITVIDESAKKIIRILGYIFMVLLAFLILWGWFGHYFGGALNRPIG